MQRIVHPGSGKQARGSAARPKADKGPRPAKPKAAKKPNGAEGVDDVALDPERNVEAEREALARLAASDFALFVDRARADPGFVFETDAVKALIKVREKSRADFARLRARLEKDAKFRRFAAVEAAMRGEAGTNEANGDGLPGRPITFEEVEPWPEPVDGAWLLDELSATVGAYIVMDKHQCDAAALWAAHAHAHDFRDTSPPLVIKSPTMRSGKTKLVEVLERLVPRPLFVSGITVSFLERAIEAHRPTLLIDEYDALTSNDPALAEAARAQLNRSAKRRGARVGKNVPLPGGGYESRLFSTWAPTVIAGIGEPPSTVRDRAVVIDLKRKMSSETVRPLRERDGADLGALKRKIARFVADNEERLRNADPAALAVDNDRAKDMWDPLLAIADGAGGDWPERARRAGRVLAEAQDSDTAEADVKLVLLADIRDIFAAQPAPAAPSADMFDPSAGGRPDDGLRISSKRLLEALVALEERPWSAWGRAKKPITGKALSDLLKPYGVRSGDVRVDDGTSKGAVVKGYYLRSFNDAFTRYLPHSGFQSSQGPTNPPFVGPLKMPETPANPGFVGPWEDEKGGVRANARIHPSAAPPNHTPPYAVLGPAPAGERCSLCGGGSPRPMRIRRGGEVSIWHEACGVQYLATLADPPPPPEGRLLSPQERVEAAERLGFEFVLEEPAGFAWIYASGVDFTDPMIKHAEAGIEANRSAVEAFLRWRQAQGERKP